jgi:plastocyanin
MKQFAKWTGFVLLAVIIGLGLAVMFTAGVQAQSPAAVAQRAVTQATPYPNTSPWGSKTWGGWGMMGPRMYGGMMGGYGGWGYGQGAAPQGTPVPADEEIQVTAVNYRFDPATISVKAGETVRLVVANKDGVPHNLYGPDVALAYTLLPAGVMQSLTFTAPPTPGTYLAVCTFHPGMSLEIVVK